METNNLFSYNTMLNYVRGNEILALKIQALIINELPKEINLMEEAANNKDWEAVGTVAHKIKPNIQMCTTPAIYDFVLNLEKDGKNKKDTGSIPSRVSELRLNIEKLVIEMKTDLDEKKLKGLI